LTTDDVPQVLRSISFWQISHWDDDHVGGVIKLLSDDAAAQIQPNITTLENECNQKWAAAFKAKTGKDLSASSFDEQVAAAQKMSPRDLTELNLFNVSGSRTNRLHLQSRYMKYDPSVDPATIPAGLVDDTQAANLSTTYFRTTMYAPFQETETNAKARQLKGTPIEASNYYRIEVPRPTIKGSKPRKGVNKFVIQDTTKTKVFNVCLRLVSDPNLYLGVEIFSNRLPAGAAACGNPGALMAAATFLNAGDYGFFIVAGGQRVLGRTQLVQPDIEPVTTSTTTTGTTTTGKSVAGKVSLAAELDFAVHNRPHKPPISHVINLGASGQVYGSPHKTPEARNAPSLCCVLLWRTAATDVALNFRVLHYSAGDAFFDVEGSVASWLTNGPERQLGLWEIYCPLMKLSQ